MNTINNEINELDALMNNLNMIDHNPDLIDSIIYRIKELEESLFDNK